MESIQGPDLKKFLDFSEKIDLNIAIRLGIEILLNLKVLHKAGYIHVDIKEDNLASLMNPINIEGEIVHFVLIDFGWATPFKSPEGEHLPPCHQLRKCGNFFYASKNALEGNAISRKDDIISVTYILLNLCIKNISWKYVYGNSEDEHRMKILECKKK